MERTPRPGEIFYLTKDEPYQVITMGIHKETCENMVIYQALFGEYNTYVLPLSKFIVEVQGDISKLHTPIVHTPDTPKTQNEQSEKILNEDERNEDAGNEDKENSDSWENVNQVLLSFLDAETYSNKLEIITAHIKEIDDRLINNMAASLDCTVDDGPMDQRLQGLICCLKQLSRFEVRRRR